VEDSLVNLINSPYAVTEENKEHLLDLIASLSEVKTIMEETRGQIGEMADGVRGLIGIEGSISRAASLIFKEIKSFEGLIDKSVSTFERVMAISKERKQL
ncbi:hypothetical protein BZG21_47515, partial [Escherichia coli]|nr:hypothetical protein [Escherichia coli]